MGGAKTYIHGTSPEEQERLALLNRLTNESFLAFLHPGADDRVLELGSGLGILARDVAAKIPGGLVVGVERSADQLGKAPSGGPRLAFVRGDAHALPFGDNRFDRVYARYVLEHVADPSRVLLESWRVLRPGGMIFLQENNILINAFEPDCPAFDRVWRAFAELQSRLGGDAQIGKKLFPLLHRAGFIGIDLTIEPEVHRAGTGSYEPWIRNLIGNVKSGEGALRDQGLASQREIDAACAELEALLRHPLGSAFFYWNRARARKPG